MYNLQSKMLRLSKASPSTNDASASRANTANTNWQKHEHSGQKWHTKHQTVGTVNGATRLTPEISAPKRGLAAEHRRNTAFSHIPAVTWRDARVQIQTTSQQHTWGRDPVWAIPSQDGVGCHRQLFDQHSGQGSDDLQPNTHRVSEGNELSALSATSSREGCQQLATTGVSRTWLPIND